MGDQMRLRSEGSNGDLGLVVGRNHTLQGGTLDREGSSDVVAR